MKDTRGASRSLRVAVVAACPFPSARGSQVLIRDTAQAVAARGHEVHVVTYPFGEHLVPLQQIHVHRGAAWRGAIARRLPYLVRKMLLDLQLIGTLNRVVRDHAIDVIHAHNYEAPLVSFAVRAFHSVPVVYHSHNALGDELGWYVENRALRRFAGWVGRWLDRQVPRRADYAIALTAELRSCLLRSGVAPQRLRIVPPGAPPQGDDDFAGDRGSCAGRFVVMYAGNLDGYQDLAVLARGFRQFAARAPEAVLVIATHETDWAQRLAPELDELRRSGALEVVMAPSFSVVRRLMRRADVLVCPRSSWSGYPIKLVNYTRAGRAIVAAEGSAKGMRAGVDALVFRNGDDQSLAAALEQLRGDPSLRERLENAAREMSAALPTWEESGAAIEQIYFEVCPSSRRRAVPIAEHTTRSEGLIGISRDRIRASGDRVG